MERHNKRCDSCKADVPFAITENQTFAFCQWCGFKYTIIRHLGEAWLVPFGSTVKEFHRNGFTLNV